MACDFVHAMCVTQMTKLIVQYLAVPHLSFIFALIVKNVPSEVSCISCLMEVRLSFVGATF